VGAVRQHHRVEGAATKAAAIGAEAHLHQVLRKGAAVHHGILRTPDLGRRDQLHGVRDLLRVLHGVDAVASVLQPGHDLQKAHFDSYSPFPTPPGPHLTQEKCCIAAQIPPPAQTYCARSARAVGERTKIRPPRAAPGASRGSALPRGQRPQRRRARTCSAHRCGAGAACLPLNAPQSPRNVHRPPADMGNACAMLFLAHAGQALRAAGPCRGARSLLSLKTLKAARAKLLLKQCLNWRTITLPGEGRSHCKQGSV